MDFTNTLNLFNKRTEDIEASLIRSFDEEVQDIDDIIRLTLGQPDFSTPEHVKNAGIKAIEENLTTYTHSKGILELREAASQFMKEKYNVDYDPNDEIITTVGATEALSTALFSIINPGDKVVIPEPFFGVYKSIVNLAGGQAILIDTSDNDFILSAKMVEDTLEEHGEAVKAIILNYPANPTGVTWTRDECFALAETLKNYPDLFVISDEIYSELVYEDQHVSMGEFLKEQTIVINGLSKSHSMTGWRIGFTFAPKEITDTLAKVHPYFVTSATTISQYAALEALTSGKDDTAPMREEFRKRRDYLYDSLIDLGFEIPKPKGAFYIYAKIPEGLIQDSYDFCLDLAQKAKVALVPGLAFGQSANNHVRISYAASFEDISEAVKRISKYVEDRKK